MAGTGEQPHIGPGIDILFDRKEARLTDCDPVAQLGAIAIAVPTDPSEQMPIAHPECDQVTTAAVIGPEHKALGAELGERRRDVARVESWTIGADEDNFVIAESRDLFRGRLQALGKSRAALLMALETRKGTQFPRGKQMEIRAERTGAEPAERKKRPEEPRQPTPGEIEPDWVSKYENSLSIHTVRIRYSAEYSQADAKTTRNIFQLPAALIKCACHPMSPNEFRTIALSMPEAFESAHMGHPDFRVNGKIFATLGYPDDGHGMVVLPLAEQAEFLREASAALSPAAGAWGRRGSTVVDLQRIKPAVLRRAIALAWQERAPQRLHNSEEL